MKLLTQQMPWRGRRPLILVLGMFDGVHCAHAALIRQAVDTAALVDGVAMVYTFLEHPLEVLSPQNAPKRLQPLTARVREIEALEPGALVLRHFDRDYAAQAPEDFIASLVESYHPSEIIVGFNYSFGRGGAGDAALLTQLGQRHGYRATIVQPLQLEGEPVSSTRIRQTLADGDVRHAALLLGRPYTLYGRMLKNRCVDWDRSCVCPGPGAYRAIINGSMRARLVIGEELRLWGLEDQLRLGARVRIQLIAKAE